jgi:hypothetical protein
MNNFNLDEPCSIDEKWTLLKAEIQEVTEGQPEKEIYMQNLERAYFEVKVELLGWEDEKDGN